MSRATYNGWSGRRLLDRIEATTREHTEVRDRKRGATGREKIVLRNRLWALRRRINAMWTAVVARLDLEPHSSVH